MREVFSTYGLEAAAIEPIVEALHVRPQAWVEFMMRFELGLEKPDPKRALTSALTIAGAYVVGGFIPLGPYIVVSVAHNALIMSVIVTLVALAVFGFIKGRFTGTKPFRGALQTTLIGGIAAAAAFTIARLVS